jgi:hypothetical protein
MQSFRKSKSRQCVTGAVLRWRLVCSCADPALASWVLDLMAGEEGFEPSHAGIKIQCLNQLGDSPTQLLCCSTARALR